MEFFIETVHQIGDSSKYSWINGFVIYGKGAYQLILLHDGDEHEIKNILSKVNENFDNVWNQGDYIKHLHERPRG